MNNYDDKLIAELECEGATAKEATELAKVAASLSVLQGYDPSMHTGRGRFGVWGLAGMALGSAAFAFVALATITLSLKSLPGQPLYPVKAVSEAMAIRLDPSLNTAVMMDKSWEVAQLATRHQPSRLVLTALDSYNYAFTGVKGDKHYAAWRYCAAELTQAGNYSTGQVREAIERSLVAVPKDRYGSG